MNRIESYVDNIVSHIQGTEEEKADLKEELKAHLNQMITELMYEGHKEDESITIALHRFGEKNSLQKELSQEFKAPRSLKRPIIALGIVLCLILGIFSGFSNYSAKQWASNITPTDGISIRDSFNPALVKGTATFEGQVDIYNKVTINKIIEYIKSSKHNKNCSEKAANNFNMKNVLFAIGTIRINSSQTPGQLSTIIIFKDSTFIAGITSDAASIKYIKGKLSKEALDYIEKVYKNPPELK